jgi:outer membrane translocation and assembly module TamA
VALSALGLELHYDDRDNPLTPTNGLNAIFQVLDYDEAIGSEADFTSALAFGSWFASRGNWTLAAMTKAETVSTGAPFFMQPAVDIRGVPASRYQGEGVVSAEIELRRQLTPRWGVLGFVGWGHAKGDDDRLFHEDVSAETWGGGIRYKIARKLGLDMGLDLAFGPEDTIFYIQFGHAWARDMD